MGNDGPFASFLGEDSVSPSFLNHYLQGMGFHVIYDPLAIEFFGELPMSI